MKNQRALTKVVFRFRYPLLILYFLVLTFVFTRPLLSRISTHIVGRYGDNLYFIWMIGWTKQALINLGQVPYKSFLLNYPYGYNLATSEIAPLQILIALPFSLADNPVLGYNISMLSTFFLSGLTMFFWIHSLTKSWGAGLVSATAFAFLPYHLAHFLIGHLNISAIQWFPLFFMGFTSILTSDEFSWKNTLILSAGLAGIALTSQYYIYMTLIVCVVILFFYLLFIRKGYFRNKQVFKQFLIAAALNIPFLILGTVPYYLLHHGNSDVRSLDYVKGFSASITDFLLPSTKSLIAGKWVFNHFPRDLWGEATLYIGLPVLALAIFGLIKSKYTEHKNLVQILIIGLVSAVILSMGTNIAWMEQPVIIHTPAWLKSLVHQENFYAYLPGYLLFRYLPFYNVMRVWMRYGIIALTLFCAAAGLGTAKILNKIKNPVKSFAAAGLIGMVLLDFMNSPFNLVRIQPRNVDLWLANQPTGGLVQLPLEQSFQESAIYYTLANQKPLLGILRTFPSDRYLQLEPILKNFPDEVSAQALRKEKITYIVLDEKYFTVDDAFISEAKSSGMNYAVSIDGQAVFILSP